MSKKPKITEYYICGEKIDFCPELRAMAALDQIFDNCIKQLNYGERERVYDYFIDKYREKGI